MSNSSRSYRVGPSLEGKFLALLLLLLGAVPITSFGAAVLLHQVHPLARVHPQQYPPRRRSMPYPPYYSATSTTSSSNNSGRWQQCIRSPFFELHSSRSAGGGEEKLSDAALDVGSSSGVRRFLGRGPQAVVREGSVLVAPPNEYHHYYRQAAIFIYEIGLMSNDNQEEEEDASNYIIRGVILDHPTPFTWQEMLGTSFQDSGLGENRLFRGGDQGGPNGIVLLHRHHRPPDDDDDPEIGSSGLYQGGWEAAVAAVQAGEAHVDDYKAFFNYCEFSETELESLLVDDESGDSWASVEVDTDLVLNADWDRGDCWKRIRNAISQHM